jgi:hypothetical protein
MRLASGGGKVSCKNKNSKCKWKVGHWEIETNRSDEFGKRFWKMINWVSKGMS